MNPTEEQLKALECFRTGEDLKINAFAGAGKTTTLSLLAQDSSKQGLYMAFNKSIANDAKEKFPKNVTCSTIHSLAFRAIMPRFGVPAKLTDRVNANVLATELDLKHWRHKEYGLSPRSQGFLVMETLRKFTQGIGQEPSLSDVPRHGKLALAPEEVIQAVGQMTVERAQSIWQRMITKDDAMPMGHDGYLKLWALSKPKLLGDFILLDEAQDSNPLILEVLKHQQAQKIYVGDRYQQIYEWRGAVNAMESIETAHTALLTQSFRFGNEIAGAASKVLEKLGEENQIRGNDKIKSYFDADHHDAILTRTNGCAMAETMESLNQGLKPHIVGGTSEMLRMLEAVECLKDNKPTDVPDFIGFESWNEVIELVKSGEGEHLKTFVNMVEKHGEVRLKQALRRTVTDEAAADLIISTAHKAKGREWRSVKLADDFFKSAANAEDPKLPRSEVQLFYVAMTRGKQAIQIPPAIMELFDIKKTAGRLVTKPVAKPKVKPVEEVHQPSQQEPLSTPTYSSQTFNPTPAPHVLSFFGIPWYVWAIGGLIGLILFG